LGLAHHFAHDCRPNRRLDLPDRLPRIPGKQRERDIASPLDCAGKPFKIIKGEQARPAERQLGQWVNLYAETGTNNLKNIAINTALPERHRCLLVTVPSK
jgi:hypothetical protein